MVIRTSQPTMAKLKRIYNHLRFVASISPSRAVKKYFFCSGVVVIWSQRRQIKCSDTYQTDHMCECEANGVMWLSISRRELTPYGFLLWSALLWIPLLLVASHIHSDLIFAYSFMACLLYCCLRHPGQIGTVDWLVIASIGLSPPLCVCLCVCPFQFQFIRSSRQHLTVGSWKLNSHLCILNGLPQNRNWVNLNFWSVERWLVRHCWLATVHSYLMWSGGFYCLFLVLHFFVVSFFWSELHLNCFVCNWQTPNHARHFES